MKNVALISNNEIINKIFTLIANKLLINLKIHKTIDIVQNVDLIIVDDFFLSDNSTRLNLNCNKLVILKNDNAPEDNFDFVIEKPFLPSSLIIRMEMILESITDINHSQKIVCKRSEHQHKDMNNDLTQFITNMIDEIDETNNYKHEDLIIKKEQLAHGGILDKNELRRLKNMVADTIDYSESLSSKTNENDLAELSHLIDQTIENLDINNLRKNNEINLTLNTNLLNEISPFLAKINKDLLVDLQSGDEIAIRLRLDNDK